MTTQRAFALSFIAGLTLSGGGAVVKTVAGQAPNQNQMVTSTVAGVPFSTLQHFVVERMTPANKTDSYVVLTFDSLGRPVVSKEQDHPRILLDKDKDAIYESEQIFSDKVRNCQGLWFDDRSLYGVCMPDAGANQQSAAGGDDDDEAGSAGVFKMTDVDGDDVAEAFEQVSPLVGRIAEHGPHAIRRGPDGQPTMIAGNFATPPPDMMDQRSVLLDATDKQLVPPVPDWRESTDARHSAVYRLDRETKQWSVVFSGNRNAYDHAYNVHGEAFTFDSDMEFDINLPWYRDVRTIHGVLGGDYGYRNNSGKYPPHYLDSLPAIRDLGRGSPVGVEFYQHYAYPRELFDNLLEGDWSRGRLLYTALAQHGGTYTARTDRAEFVHGEPMNITDHEVGPDGMVYFTTGGRGTQGGLWRVRYTGTAPPQPDMTGMLAVVRQPQPLSSWGWAAIEKVKASMGASFGAELEQLARDTAAEGMDRARAIYEMQRHAAPPSTPLLQALVTDQDADVRRAVTYVAGVQGEPAKAVVATALEDVDPMVKRRALEALVRMGQSSDKPGLVPVSDILALLNDNDRFVRWAARTVLERTPRAEWKDHVLEETNPLGAIEGMVAWIRTAGSDSVQPIIDKQFTMVKESLSIENQLRLYRAIQLTAIDLPGGLPLERRRELYDVLAARFPAQDERLNRELSLLLAYTGQAGAVGEILAAMPTEHENQALQIWYAYTLRTVKDGWEAEQKIELARWFGQAAKWRGGSSYARYMGQLFDQSMEFFTEEERSAAAELAPDYAPLTPQELSQIAAREQQEQAGRGAGAGPGGRAAGARQSGQSQAAEPRSAGAQAQTAERPRPGTQTTLARRSVGVSRTSKEEIFEYQIFVPQRREPDPSEGRRIFESDCGSCHRFGGVGTDHGSSGPPSLTDITARATKREMLESILWPSDTVAAEHQTTTIETADGRTIKGLVLKEDAQTVTLKTTTDERPVEMPTAQIKSRSKTNSSIMPENLLDAYSQQQIAGLLAFLLAPPPAGATAQ